MDNLKNKAYRTYNYISRYASFPYYYNELDDKYVYGITSQLNDDGIAYVAHRIIQEDTLDSLSLKYYGRPDLYWVIADFNRIQDPLEELFGKYDSLKIPNISNIEFEN